jgi:CheY-like chemotaxis protein
MTMPSGGFFSVDSLRGVWILVVDSDPHGRRTLLEILSYCGALVTPVAAAEDALSVMQQVKPDLLIAALLEGDDFDFIRRVRALKPEDGGVVPAIAIGAADALDDVARARGFQAYMRTPLDPWGLCRLVSSLMTVR